jgi:transaldolase
VATGIRSKVGSPVRALLSFGQSPWLDFIQRGLLTSGELEHMISEWGISGLTSNPVIFEKAIAHTREYESDIATLAKEGLSAEEIYEALAVQDVQHAADLLLPVHEASAGADGFASLEVSPHSAHDAAATITEAKHLWSALGRRNVLVKVPGTEQGLTAIRSLLADGINVNVTLLFSVSRYRDVLDAYLQGLEGAAANGRDLAQITSVASFFLSRIDTKVDAELDRIAAADEARRPEAAALRGETAIASARLAYSVFGNFFESARFRRLGEQRARRQRLLWASTGTKDPTYSDVKYIEALIGPQTINTMPLETVKAYNDHGKPQLRLTNHARDAVAILEQLGTLGIDLDALTEELLRQGIEKFAIPHDALIAAIETSRRAALSTQGYKSEREIKNGGA